MKTEQGRHGDSIERLLTTLRQDTERLLSEKVPPDMVDLVEDSNRPAVAALLRRSVDILDPTTQERFMWLGGLAPEPGTFDLRILARRWRVTEDEARTTVNTLIDHGLVEPLGNGEYQMHALLITLARSIAERRDNDEHRTTVQ